MNVTIIYNLAIDSSIVLVLTTSVLDRFVLFCALRESERKREKKKRKIIIKGENEKKYEYRQRAIDGDSQADICAE